MLTSAAAAAIVSGLIPTNAALGATYRVTSIADTTGGCSPEPAPCTLRQATEAASALADNDTIILPANTYNVAGQLTFNNTSATLKGDGAGVTTIHQFIAGHRVFRISGASNVGIDGVTISGGGFPVTGGVGGGGVSVEAGNGLTLSNSVVTQNAALPNGTQGGAGGGIFSSGSLTIVNSSIVDNTATGGSAEASAGGGIAQLNGTLNITDSTIASNHANPGTAVAEAGGGGGLAAFNAAVTIDRSTISGNTAGGNDGGIGGAIFAVANSATFPLSITNSTINGNTVETASHPTSGGGGIFAVAATGFNLATTLTSVTLSANTVNGAGSGGNLRQETGTATLKNSIVSGGTAGAGANCSGAGTFTPAGRNLEDADTCQLGPGDIKNTDPQLAPLAANGGPTQTRALSSTSPALGAGLDCPPPATDQRGVARPQRNDCDLGAFELVRSPNPADTAPAVVSALAFKPARFAALGKGRSVISKKSKKKAARGSTVSYVLSEPAGVAFTVEKLGKGRKKGKRCVSKRKKGKRCTIAKTLKGSFSLAGKQGANSFRFSGRLSGKKLKPGSYRLVSIPTDAAGNKGTAVRRNFRVVK